MCCDDAHQEETFTYGYIGLSDFKVLKPEVYEKLLLKCEWQKEHELAFLIKEGIDELPEVVKTLLAMRK